MKIEKQFNKSSAQLVEVHAPVVNHVTGPNIAGVAVEFFAQDGTGRKGLYMTPAEASAFGQQLIKAAPDGGLFSTMLVQEMERTKLCIDLRTVLTDLMDAVANEGAGPRTRAAYDKAAELLNP